MQWFNAEFPTDEVMVEIDVLRAWIAIRDGYARGVGSSGNA